MGDLDYFCSSIEQPVEDIAKMAVELLLQDTMKPPLVCLPVKYVYGGTTLDGKKRVAFQIGGITTSGMF
ncbi:hypothetical protein P261_01021 [Lachnospiraceae bacterium TWA4]|nr:hypothetical protein P261_01021 [Lachnospiraceae bacterium TWA4]